MGFVLLRLCIAVCCLMRASFSLYHTAGEVLHFFSHAAQSHPSVRFDVKLATVPLPIVTLSDAAKDGKDAGKPVALLVFGEHAREVITTEVALWLSKVLLGDVDEMVAWPQMQGALRDAGVRADRDALHAWSEPILQRLTLKILPIENMDGRTLWEAGELCMRKTRSQVDLNRNYDFAWQKLPKDDEMYGGEAPFSEPQTRYVRDQARRWRPHAFVNVHSGEWAVYTPWDSRNTLGAGLPGDLEALVSRLSALCDCMAGPSGAVSNYLAFGTSMDWMYSELGVQYPFTVEVYGGGGEGKLQGKHNPALSSFPATDINGSVVPSGPASSRRMLRTPRGRRRSQQAMDPIAKLVAGSSKDKRRCFEIFNPSTEPAYREVVSRWVVVLMALLSHVAKTKASGHTDDSIVTKQ